VREIGCRRDRFEIPGSQNDAKRPLRTAGRSPEERLGRVLREGVCKRQKGICREAEKHEERDRWRSRGAVSQTERRS
jgi:hypothetical protein